jgi:methionine aminopeptidase
MVAECKQKCDGWAVVTQHNKLSAQWEPTIAITADRDEVLRLRQEKRQALLLSAEPFAK